MRKPITILGAVLLALAPVAGALPTRAAQAASAAPAAPAEQAFGYTGQAQSFTVPAGVQEITISATGGAGGDGSGNTYCANGSGGAGGTVTGTLAVSAGYQLSIFVGGGGHLTGGGGLTSPNGRTGGSGGAGSGLGSGNGGGGGGATTVETLLSGILTAGGGGGGGGLGVSALQCGGTGGDAGSPAQPGHDGTASTPGAYGRGGTPGASYDMNGGHGQTWSGAGGGGGAGDGDAPGGGGAADQSGVAAGGGGGGAGGGSSADARLQNVRFGTAGGHGSAGSVLITWRSPSTTIVPPASAFGGDLPLHAIVSDTDGGGTVDFIASDSSGATSNALIAGCTGVPLAPVGNGVDFEASCDAALQLVGGDTIIANYSGDTATGASSASNGYTITQQSSATSMSTSVTTVPAGQTVSMAVAVAGTDGYGAVQLTDNGSLVPNACAALSSSGPTRTTQCVDQVTAGQHVLVATYTGDRGYRPSSSSAITVTATTQSGPNAPDLAAGLTTVGSFVHGHRATLVATVTNAGNAATAQPTTLTLTLPPGLSAVRANGAGWQCSTTVTTIACTRAARLAVNQAAAVTVKVQVTAKAGASLSATAVATPADTGPASNSASVRVTVQA